MKPEDFELFLKDVDQFVYNSSSAGKENSFPSNYEHERTLLELLILKYIRKPFKLYLTGLQAIGLAADDDVVDMHIVLGKNYYERSKDSTVERDCGTLAYLARVMEFSGDWKITDKYFEDAMMECRCIATGRRIRLSLGNGLRVEQFKILNHLFKLQPEAVPFFMFLRHWIKEKSVCSINTKCLVLLVIFYLQKSKMMPSLFEVFLNVPKNVINGHQVQFDDRRSYHYYRLYKMDNYRNHILDFFNFYQYFDFQYYILNMYRGYKVKIRNYWSEFHSSSALNIVFIEHDRNFSANVRTRQVDDFRNVCKVSHRLFQKYL